MTCLIFFFAATKDEPDGDNGECRGRQQNGGGRGKLPYNGYSEECLDRLEPNGNIPHDKDPHYGKLHYFMFFIYLSYPPNL
jgi:hypothetical protein